MSILQHHLDPLDPYDPYLIEQGFSENRQEQDYENTFLEKIIGSIVSLAIIIFIFAFISIFTGCSTTKDTSYIERRRMEIMIDRMDSLMHVKTVIQQDSSWRELVMRQFQSIREKSDTSHTMVVDSAGNVIREKIIINNIRETTSETDRQELQVMTHRLETMDSTMNIMQQQICQFEELIKEKQKVKEVEKPLTMWQQARIWLANLVLVALAVMALVWVARKRAWWKPSGS